MANFVKEYHNSIKLMEAWFPDADLSHITYDPDMKGSDREYWRMESSGGDGTLAFTVDMLRKLLIPLVAKTTCFKPTAPKPGEANDIEYTIGKIRHAVVFGQVELRCGGKYPGLRERVRIPVRCRYFVNQNKLLSAK